MKTFCSGFCQLKVHAIASFHGLNDIGSGPAAMKRIEDYAIGDSRRTLGRTITETDNVMFSAMTHNPARLHLDEEYCRTESEFGTRIVNSCFTLSLMVGISAILVGGTIGTVAGLVSGYFGGWIDDVLMRLGDIQLAFPFILLAIMFLVVLGPGLFNLIVVLGIGNVLWADEGFGVRCVEALQQRHEFAPHVSLVDGGTQGLYLIQHVQSADCLLIFDAIDYGLVSQETLALNDGLILALLGLSGAILVHRDAWIGLPHAGDALVSDPAVIGATVRPSTFSPATAAGASGVASSPASASAAPRWRPNPTSTSSSSPRGRSPAGPKASLKRCSTSCGI